MKHQVVFLDLPRRSKSKKEIIHFKLLSLSIGGSLLLFPFSGEAGAFITMGGKTGLFPQGPGREPGTINKPRNS